MELTMGFGSAALIRAQRSNMAASDIFFFFDRSLFFLDAGNGGWDGSTTKQPKTIQDLFLTRLDRRLNRIRVLPSTLISLLSKVNVIHGL